MIKGWRFRNNKINLGVSVLFILTVFFCVSADKAQAGYFDYDDVLVVINDNSATSTTIGNHFITSRGIASTSVIHINTVTSEGVNRTEFTNNIRTPIENFITSRGIATSTNYIVTTKGVPLRLNDTTQSLESELALILGPYSGSIGNSNAITNPYRNVNKKFSRATYGIYGVTRLDGYTISDVLGLIDRSHNSTTTNIGSFALDVSPGRDNPTYRAGNDWMRNATTSLIARGYNVILDQTNLFLTNQTNLLGYYSWGSNDSDANTYTTNAIPHNTYKNGAIAETIVSTGARSFAVGTTYGQSLIADLIAEGVSGVKGYVAEPFLGAIAHADVLFDRYTAGYNMADSFLAASAQSNWKDVIIGDPKMVIAKIPLPFDVVSPTNNIISASQSPTFTWNETDSFNGISKYQLYIDGVLNRDNITGTSTTPLTDLSPGVHTWYIKAIDSIGGESVSISTRSINIVPDYSSGYTFYVDNVLGDDSNPGSMAEPWATLGKAGSTVSAGDTVIIIKNEGSPYRETLQSTKPGTATGTITFRGVDKNSKPEIWGSDDVSNGWSVYGGGAANTYQRALTIEPKVVAVGSSTLNLSTKKRGASAATLNPGEWFWVSNVLYYKLDVGEVIGGLQIEAAARNYAVQLQNYLIVQDIITRYSNFAGLSLTGISSLAQRVESYDSVSGLSLSGNGAAVKNSIFARNRDYGVTGLFPVNGSLTNTISYDNNSGAVNISTLMTTKMTLQNNIFYENGVAPSVSFNILGQPNSITASNNLWDVAGDADWNIHKGVNNQELKDPLLLNPVLNNFQLQEFSPAIDSGTLVSGVTTDIVGNPIYGTPDIGPYEYQPPYQIGTDSIDMSGSIRLYSDGKYRYTSAHSGGTSTSLSITPVGGFGTGNYSEFMDITISRWDTSGDYQKNWTATSTIATSTVQTIGNMNPNHLYDIFIDGATTPYTQARADSGGTLTFTYSGGYSAHTFYVIKNDYGCINSTATNYDPTATIDNGSCTYVSSGGGSSSGGGGNRTKKIETTSIIPTAPAVSPETLNPSEVLPSETVSSKSKPVIPVSLTQNLSFGMTSSEVTALQIFLAQDSTIYPEGIVSGYFGQLTELAVQRYQQKHSIVSAGTPSTTGYGMVGPRTREMMGRTITELFTPTSTSKDISTETAQPSKLQAGVTTRSSITLTQNLSFGMTSSEVTALQIFLAQDSTIYPEGIVSGYFGQLTELAVQRYQQKHSIVSAGTPSTTGYGMVGPRTREMMGGRI